MIRYFFCKVICICQNGSVAGRQPPGEDVGEGCSVPAAHQIGCSSISNILGNSWGLPIHVLRVFWIFLLKMDRRFAPPSWLSLDRRHCRCLCILGSVQMRKLGIIHTRTIIKMEVFIVPILQLF